MLVWFSVCGLLAIDDEEREEKGIQELGCFSIENSEVTVTGTQATNLQAKGLRKLVGESVDLLTGLTPFALCKHQGFFSTFMEILNLKNHARSRCEKSKGRSNDDGK